jgi:hypothetical protein
MTNVSDGEIFGAKALNLTIIGMSVLIMLGVLWQPAPVQISANKPAAQIERVVAKTPAARPVEG